MSANHSPSDSSSTSQANAARSRRRAWVQSSLAIATGYLFIALGVVGLMGLIEAQTPAQAPIAFTPPLLLILGLAQVVLATAGGYITALLAPAEPAEAVDLSNPHQPAFSPRSSVKHSLGLMLLTWAIWGISAIASPGQAPLSVQLLNFATAILGIGTGSWLRDRQLRSPS